MDRALALTLTLALIVPLLSACTLGGVEVEQEQASGLAGELLDGHSFGQTLTPRFDGLYRIDLYTATYARENTRPVIFRISAAPDATGDLVRLELPAAQISNSGPTLIIFSPLAGTAGQRLYFSVESPGAVPGDAITIYRHDEDVYAGGEMYVDGRPAGGDLAFIAYTREAFTAAGIWGDLAGRARRDGAFTAFYCSLLVLVVVARAVALAWPRRGWKGRDGEDGSGKSG